MSSCRGRKHSSSSSSGKGAVRGVAVEVGEEEGAQETRMAFGSGWRPTWGGGPHRCACAGSA
eukprot:scaffold149816_cov12-Tisochrysis_lutea.AAC.1